MRAVRTLRRAWREFKEGKPGRRFQDHYCRKHDPHSGDGRRFGFIVGGISLVVLGALLSILPWVPGFVLGAMGALLLCAESQTAARALDFIETGLRFALCRLRRTAHRLHR
jgi:hypothetical protein